MYTTCPNCGSRGVRLIANLFPKPPGSRVQLCEDCGARYAEAEGGQTADPPPPPTAKGATPELTETEQNILEAIGTETLKGPAIASKSGYDYDTVRHVLPLLIRFGVLEKTAQGYRRPV